MTTPSSPFSNLGRRRRGREQSFLSPGGGITPSFGAPQPTPGFGGPLSGFGGFQPVTPPAFNFNQAPVPVSQQPLAGIPDDFGFGGQPFGQPPSTQNPNNIFRDFLEEEPDIPFFGRLFSQEPRGQGESRDRFTPNQQAAFRNQRQQFFDMFQAKIFEQIQAGQLPTARFADFTRDLDFGREFNQQFGPDTARFAPRTQFLNR